MTVKTPLGVTPEAISIVIAKTVKSIKLAVSGDKIALDKIKVRVQLKCELQDGHIRSVSYIDVVTMADFRDLRRGFIRL